MKKGTRVRYKATGEEFTYAGIDGSCAKMMRAGFAQPIPFRLWYVHECFELEDGTPIVDGFWYGESA